MRPRCVLKVYLGAMIAACWLALPHHGAAAEWTLSTADTSLTIGVIDGERPAITALRNGTEQHNWIEEPNPIPLLSNVVCNGASVATNWEYQGADVDNSDGTKLTLQYGDPTTGLVMQSQWWARPGRGPIHHSSYITNKGSSAVTIPYQPTLSLQLNGPSSGALDAWHFSSDAATPDPQGVFRQRVTSDFKALVSTCPAAGGSIPLVVLDSAGCQGVYVGTEWSLGDIAVSGSPTHSQGASILSGNVLNFQTTLGVGEVFEVPPGFVGAYSGNVDAAGNSLRKYLFKYNTPEILRTDESYPKVSWNVCIATGKTPGSWDSVESKYYPAIDDIVPLGFEEAILDIGWWSGGEPDADPSDWPTGMKAAADYAHQRGLKLGLYWADNAGNDWQTRGNRVKRLFAEHDADMWRSDCTSGEFVECNYGSVKGFYDMLDRLQKEIPGFQWENCKGGGRIKDYGAMKRAMKVFNSDTYTALDVRRAFHDSSYALLPMQIEGHLVTIHTNATDGSNRPTGPRELKYAFRAMSMGAPGWIIDAPNGSNSTPWTDEEKRAVAECVTTYITKIRALVRTADLYHVFPRPDDHVWDGIQYFDSTTQKGVVYIFKPDSAEDTHRLLLQGLDADQTYLLTFEDGSNPTRSMTGAELMNVGIDITLHGTYVSELMFIEVPEPSSAALSISAGAVLFGFGGFYRLGT